MINGVKVKRLNRLLDDRGFLCEVIKAGEDLFIDIKQTTYTETYPDVIKAFHWHKQQTDVWFVVKGQTQIVLHDLRVTSPTYKQTDVVYCGGSYPLVILIPPGVAHGCRVLGLTPAGLLYHTDAVYNPDQPDEERLPFDDPSIGFDWQTRNR